MGEVEEIMAVGARRRLPEFLSVAKGRDRFTLATVLFAIFTASFVVPAASILASELAGKALSFSGNQWTIVADSPSLRLGAACTIEMWVRPTAFGTHERIVNKGDGQFLNSNRAYEIVVSAPERPAGFGADYFSGSLVGWTSIRANATRAPGVWTHIAATYDAIEGTARLYIDGILIEELKKTTGDVVIHEAIYPSDFPLFFGSFIGNDLFFTGSLDEVRIWNVARSPAEIAQHFNRIANPNTPGLVGYWKFDEGNGDQEIVDTSPYHNHGVLGPISSNTLNDPARIESTAPILAACDGDLNGDYQVDDADFTVFVLAYVTLLCEDPAMPSGCPADFNRDGVVDDADFVIFGQAYDRLLCP